MKELISKRSVIDLIEEIQRETKTFDPTQLYLLKQCISGTRGTKCVTIEDLKSKDVSEKARELCFKYHIMVDSPIMDSRDAMKALGSMFREVFEYVCDQQEEK